MSFLQKSIGSRALSSSARLFPRQASLIHVRSYTDNATRPDEPPGPKLSESSLVKQEGPAESMARHQPDYDVAPDYRTSYVWLANESQHRVPRLLSNRTFSPIPKRVMDGSEPGETVPAAVLSGAPMDLQARTVRYVPFTTLTLSSLLMAHLEYTGLQNPLHNLETGMACHGLWTGIHYLKGIAGRTHLWAGNHPPTSCKASELDSSPKKTPSDLQINKDMNILFRNPMIERLFPRLMQTSSSIVRRSSRL